MGLVNYHCWWLISYDYVAAEQVLGALNAYHKDLLCQYRYSLSKYFESAQRTTDAELCVRLNKRRRPKRMAYPEIWAQKSLTMEILVALK